MNIVQAASSIERTLGAWRFRIGRDNEECVELVDGFSFTWRIEFPTPTENVGEGERWVFTFSLRRESKWFKTSVTVTPTEPDFEDEDEEIVYTEDLVKAAGFDLLTQMMAVAFPEVKE